MNQKKVFSYLVWFLYSMILCVALLGVTGVLTKQAGYSGAVGYGISAVWLVLCGLIVFLIHKLTADTAVMDISGRMPALVTESLTVVILFVVGIVLRMGGMFGAGDGGSYYELAKVAEGQTISPVAHGAVYFYLQLLHLVYTIFGNDLLIGIWLQIILQMVAGFFFYRAVRKMAGVISSLVTLGFIMVGPSMINETLSLSPKMLFLAVYAIVLFVCVKCTRGNKGPVKCLLTGLLTAVVCYLDIMGITLLLFIVAGVLLKKNEDDLALSQRMIRALLCVLGGVIGFALLMFVDSMLSGKSFLSVVAAWGQLYIPTTFEFPAMLEFSQMSVEIMCLLLVMTIGIFSYWCSYYTERLSLWIWLVVMQILLLCFGMTTEELNGELNLYITFAVLAGVGISGIFASDGEEDEADDEEEISDEEVTGAVAEPAEAEPAPEVSRPTEEDQVIEDQVIEDQVIEDLVIEDLVIEDISVPAEEPEVKLIENPLPLPKKHVKKVLDYDVELNEELDDFDYAVDEDDDFDI